MGDSTAVTCGDSTVADFLDDDPDPDDAGEQADARRRRRRGVRGVPGRRPGPAGPRRHPRRGPGPGGHPPGVRGRTPHLRGLLLRHPDRPAVRRVLPDPHPRHGPGRRGRPRPGLHGVPAGPDRGVRAGVPGQLGRVPRRRSRRVRGGGPRRPPTTRSGNGSSGRGCRPTAPTSGPAELAVAAVYTSYSPTVGSTWARPCSRPSRTTTVRRCPTWRRATTTSAASPPTPPWSASTRPRPPVPMPTGRSPTRPAPVSPRFGGRSANELLPCATWPVRPVAAPAAITAPGAPPILVVGNTGDPATPYDNAVDVADQLSSGVLVTADIDGHTAYGIDRCVTRVRGPVPHRPDGPTGRSRGVRSTAAHPLRSGPSETPRRIPGGNTWSTTWQPCTRPWRPRRPTGSASSPPTGASPTDEFGDRTRRLANALRGPGTGRGARTAPGWVATSRARTTWPSTCTTAPSTSRPWSAPTRPGSRRST